MATEGEGRAVFVFHVTLLRRGARAISTTDPVVHDVRRQAAPVCGLLRWRTWNHGGGQSRRIRSRRAFYWTQYPASARTAIQSVYHAGTEFPVSLFFYAQTVV